MSRTPETGQPVMKRPWFQFHLSTAIVLVFVAGGLIWANMRPVNIRDPDLRNARYLTPLDAYGFPLTAVEIHGYRALVNKRTGEACTPPGPSERRWSTWGVAVDAATAATTLAAAALLCEFLIRRRKHKP
jgi:hypothetical protein